MDSQMHPETLELNGQSLCDVQEYRLKRRHRRSNSDPEFSPIRKTEMLFNFLTTLMTLGGAYYRPLNRKCPYLPWDFIYCCSVLFLCSIEAVRTFYYYEKGEDFATKIFKAIEQIYVIKMLFSLLVSLIIVTPRLRRFFHSADIYHTNWVTEVDMNEVMKQVRNQKRRVIVCFVCLSGFRIFIGVLPMFQLQVCNNWAKPLLDRNVNRHLVAFICTFFRLFFQCADSMCYIFIYVLSAKLADEFVAVASNLQQYLEDGGESDGSDLKQHRWRYLDLCDLMDTLDRALGPLILHFCVFDLIIVVLHVIAFMDFDLYGLSSKWTRVIGITSVVDKAMHMALLIYAGSNVSSKAKAVKPFLSRIDVESYTQAAFQEGFMFLQKVTQDHIGLTAWGMFNINKSFIVTVVSLGLTYAIIMMRFGMMITQESASNSTASPTFVTATMSP